MARQNQVQKTLNWIVLGVALNLGVVALFNMDLIAQLFGTFANIIYIGGGIGAVMGLMASMR